MTSPVISEAALTTSQTDRAVLAIREMLLRGDFEPGERISELPLAARLAGVNVSISRTPLRRALDLLAHEGLLRTWPTGGYVVCTFTVADVWDTIEMRGVLEGTAARFAAERLENDGELAHLRELSARLDALVPPDASTFSRYLEFNQAFHSEIWRLSKSPVVLRALEQVVKLPFASPSALVFGPKESAHADLTSRMAQVQHRALIEAIANREGARAENLAREHSRIARQNLTRALGDTELIRRVPGAALIDLKIA